MIAGSHPAQRVSAANACPDAGLVPYKTNCFSAVGARSSVILSSPAQAEHRVKCLKRAVWASGHLHGVSVRCGFRPPVPWFVTLTYAKASAWLPLHVAKAVDGFRRWCKSHRVPCRYTWVGEIQPKRLATSGDAVVHYHLIAWLPPGLSMPHWDKPTRKRGGTRPAFWPHGMTNSELARSGIGYLMKYLSKLGELTVFPKGLRLYGIGGLDVAARAVRSWYNLPEWAKAEFGVGELVRKSVGLVVRETGEILAPAYRITVGGGQLIFEQLREVVPRWHDGAYSTFPRSAS